MEAKDTYTFRHTSRVQEYAIALGIAEGLPYNKIESIKDAAILHDIGKIGISDVILNKEEKLTKNEFEEIKTNLGTQFHPRFGQKFIDIMND